MTNKRKTKEIVRPNIKSKKTKEKAYEEMFKKSEEPKQEKPKEQKEPKKPEKEKKGYSLRKDVIKALQMASIDLEITYSELIEKAIENYVDKKYFE
jgi:flagellar hook-basal body complex protein FliE